jgi:hypothetical protein
LPVSTSVRILFLPPSPDHTPPTSSAPATRRWKVRCVMEVVHPRCAGIDVSKKDAKVCVRIQGGRGRKTTSTVTTWGAMTNQVLALKDHLAEQGVTVAVMESTSDYWRPFYYVLEADLEVPLVNARDVKNVPGPQNRCLRRRLAGRPRRPRTAPGIVRAAGTDPATAGPDQGTDPHHPGPDPGDPTRGEAVGIRVCRGDSYSSSSSTRAWRAIGDRRSVLRW